MNTWRVAFETPRAHEYFDKGGLRTLIGHDVPLWPLVLIKELADNALDACETAGIAPEIAITVEPDAFSVADNAGGLKPEIIDGSLTYEVRISDKKWYVCPTRGQLGSALKTLWPACAVATGTRSVVEVFSCGWHHTITAYGGEIKSHEKKPAAVRKGTFIKVHWPRIALQPDVRRTSRFLPRKLPGPAGQGRNRSRARLRGGKPACDVQRFGGRQDGRIQGDQSRMEEVASLRPGQRPLVFGGRRPQPTSRPLPRAEKAR